MSEFPKKIILSSLRIFKTFYWWLVNLGYKLRFRSVYNIPVVINNFNRLTYPLQLIEFLERCGFTNIVILDNNSTYPPLLKFYESCKHKVIRLAHNYGHLAFWKSGHYNNYKWSYYIYTDSDVAPVEECPKDFIRLFKSELDRHSKLDKIGFGIRIDDLPDSFLYKEKIVDYEKRYWANEVQPNLYDAPIDTTFALYKPMTALKADEVFTLKALRTGFPYVIRHLPWYVDSKNLSEEESYYLKTSNSSSSLGKQQKGDEEVY